MALGSLKASPPAWKGSRPQNIGILAMEIYFPAMYVAQQELEVHDGVSAGLLMIHFSPIEIFRFYLCK